MFPAHIAHSPTPISACSPTPGSQEGEPPGPHQQGQRVFNRLERKKNLGPICIVVLAKSILMTTATCNVSVILLPNWACAKLVKISRGSFVTPSTSSKQMVVTLRSTGRWIVAQVHGGLGILPTWNDSFVLYVCDGLGSNRLTPTNYGPNLPCSRVDMDHF